MKNIKFLIIISVFLYGCGESATNNDIKVVNFNPFANFKIDDDSLLIIDIDYTNAIDSGFIIPSINQIARGKFAVTFDIVNNSGIAKEFYYKIYYQNESYKFPETHIHSNENFYGSWENTSKTFVATGKIDSDGKTHTINDEIRIVGNPRNETCYFGKNNTQHNQQDIISTIDKIKGDANWYKQIVEKAKNNNISIEKQLELDAIYILNQNTDKDGVNQRWKRNPRVGSYKFLLVLIEKEEYEAKLIPDYIQDISMNFDNTFINPFYYFLYGDGSKLKNVYLSTNNSLKLIAKPNLGSGIYIDKDKLAGRTINKSYYSNECGEDNDLYNKAHFQQFFHDLRSEDIIKNVPLVKDIFNEDYTIDDFENNKLKYTDDKLIVTNVQLTDCPCKTVKSDIENQKIVMINPSTKEGEWKKESVGVKTRHGFTYGKYRSKVKMTELLNKHGVWNGITNAIWLIFQNGEWNNRRTCDNKGYIPKDQYGRDSQRVNSIDYSEIDFEIIKTSRDWPKTSYSEKYNIKPSNNDKKEDIIVACTNWDMACPSPSKFDVGVHTIEYNNETFYLHRWDHWYKALTSKIPANESELFESEYYYFEIEWKPTEIIWRIGPSVDKMKVVGYMNEEYSSIPNNQMLMVFTQEFHLGDWWPLTQFHQNYIPFPQQDYKGEIYEIVIE